MPVDHPNELELEPGQQRIPIGRDPSFVRLVADDFTVINQGFNVDLSLIVAGPDPDMMLVQASETAIGTSFNTISTGLSASYSEVARVRMVAHVAMGMAMQIIEQSVRRGVVNIPALRVGFETMLASIEAEKDVGEVGIDDLPSATPDPGEG